MTAEPGRAHTPSGVGEMATSSRQRNMKRNGPGAAAGNGLDPLSWLVRQCSESRRMAAWLPVCLHAYLCATERGTTKLDGPSRPLRWCPGPGGKEGVLSSIKGPDRASERIGDARTAAPQRQWQKPMPPCCTHGRAAVTTAASVV